MATEIGPVGPPALPPEAAMLRELAERVAALEERLAYPLMMTGAPETVGEQVAELEDSLRQATGDGAFGRHRIRVLPPAPVLTPESAEALLRQCVTVVKPGETLVIRTPDTWNLQQADETWRRLSEIIAGRDLGFTVLLVPGEEFAVAKPGPDPVTVEMQVEGIVPALVTKELHRQMSRAMHQGRPAARPPALAVYA